MKLNPFDNEVVFKKHALFFGRSCTKRRKVINDGVPDAKITKINLFRFSKFISKISGKRRKHLNDEAFFEQP